ncbi:MAG TPA: polyprenyl synthetase family protein [Anaerolineales bacterium]|nr:polyprenyl synthetase family protein [Anaerolineae bacterium]HIQ02216.1 polyprenyl synthetase family protein [Anaerolineales bacterium]
MLLKHLPFLDLIRNDLERVEVILREQPPEQHEAVGVAVDHLIGGGGKRLRPALVLLSAYLCGADVDRAVLAAAAAEMLHTATLIHDDLIDGSLVRRGTETLNASWTPGATVLTGDYVFARAAYLVSLTDTVLLMRRFAETLMVICNGEIRQMFDGRRGEGSRQEYEQRIYDKTASLIALSAEAGAILAGADDRTRGALRTYGEQLGLAFQIVDDVLDFVADEEVLGKPVGGDLRQGLVTLPLLLFLEADPDHPTVRRALKGADEVAVQEAVRTIADSPAVGRSLEVARGYIERASAALAPCPSGPYREALEDLAHFVVERRF